MAAALVVASSACRMASRRDWRARSPGSAGDAPESRHLGGTVPGLRTSGEGRAEGKRGVFIAKKCDGDVSFIECNCGGCLDSC